MKNKVILSAAFALICAVMTTGCDSNSSEVLSSVFASSSETAQAEEVALPEIVSSPAADTNTELSSGEHTEAFGSKDIDYTAAYIVDGKNAVIDGGTYSADTNSQNVFLVVNGGTLTIKNAVITKILSDDSDSESEDGCNFYGTNSAVAAVGEGSKIIMENCSIYTSCEGANAVFSTNGANINAENLTIITGKDSSRGLDATYGGEINAKTVNITTNGSHCAPLATDRGGGTITVDGNSVLTSYGDGSPCIYSTGDITVTSASGSASGSQAVVVEGKNSVTLNDCTFESNGNNGVMMYQSASGDASDKDSSSDSSYLTLSNTTLKNLSSGPMFYITNTSAVINTEDCMFTNSQSTAFVNAAAGRFGSESKNGGTLTLNAKNQEITGSIEADNISTVTVNLSSDSLLNGSTGKNVTVNSQ